MEPVTHSDAVTNKMNHRDNGFAMGFSASVHPIELNQGVIIKHLARARVIYEMTNPPHGHTNCGNCQIVEKMLGIAKESLGS